MSELIHREILLARLTSGTLERVKKPERLRLLGEPPVVKIAPRLRVGYPSAARSTPFFACAGVSLGDAWPRDLYRLVDSTDARLRFVRRDSMTANTGPWPDTLVARLFDESADEEIALERGEIEAAVFWPGEASTYIRDAFRWSGDPAGIRARGYIAIGAGRDSAALDSMSRTATLREDLEALNREIFRGDLLALLPAAPPGDRREPTDAHIEYRAEGPDRIRIGNFLGRGAAGSGAPPGPGVVTIAYRDEPLATAGTPFRRPVFAIRCPILPAPAFRATIEAIGADALVNFFDCRPAERP